MIFQQRWELLLPSGEKLERSCSARQSTATCLSSVSHRYTVSTPSLISALGFNTRISQQAYTSLATLRSKEQEHALSKVYPVLDYYY